MELPSSMLPQKKKNQNSSPKNLESQFFQTLKSNLKNLKRKLHWDTSEDEGRNIKWHQREEISIERLRKVINNEINDEFGLGDTRSLQDYENLCGVDLKNMKVLDKQKAYTSEFISKLSWQDSSF